MKYRPPKSSRLYEQCNPKPDPWLNPLASGMISTFRAGVYQTQPSVWGRRAMVPPLGAPWNPTIGDRFYDPTSLTQYTWDGTDWLQLSQGSGMGSWHSSTTNVMHSLQTQALSMPAPTQDAVTKAEADYQREYYKGVSLEELDRKYGKRSPS